MHRCSSFNGDLFFPSLLINIAVVDDIGVIDSVFGGGLVGCGARRSRPR